jgi:hypothetical protein
LGFHEPEQRLANKQVQERCEGAALPNAGTKTYLVRFEAI